ncbi:beta-2-glycoprotein 1-like [Cetorhinus maximus]
MDTDPRLFVPTVDPLLTGPCGDPPGLARGFYQRLESGRGRAVRYGCSPGFRLQGPESNSCLENGTWARAAPICRPLFCQPPAQIEHGSLVAVEKSRYRVREKIYYLCQKGFTTEGSNEVTCTAQGTWSAGPVCQAPCAVGPYRSRVLYNGLKLWLSSLPGGMVRHRDELVFYCLDEEHMCSYPVKSQCVNGQLQVPACYKEPTWVRFTLFHWKVVSELEECEQEQS